MLGLHLLHGLTQQLTHSVILGTDSQAVIKALNNQLSHSGHYLLDAIHLAAERLHAKQDGIINCEERVQAINAGDQWKGDSRGVINLQIHWVPGHCDFAPNERADEEAKLAAQGSSSDSRFLPPLLRKKLPLSISALRQENSVKLKKRWSRRWKSSERKNLLRSIDSSAPSKKYLHVISDLDRRQASILFQLCTGHIGLNQHLFHIRKAESPACPLCQGITVETIKHFLLECPHYRQQRHILQRKLCRNVGSLSFLLNSPVAVRPLLNFVRSTGRFKAMFGKDIDDKINTNARRNGELQAAGERLKHSIRKAVASNCKKSLERT